MDSYNPHCTKCAHKLGLSRKHNHNDTRLRRCTVCGQVKPCLVKRKKILDFEKFFDNAKPKRRAHV